MLPLSLSLSFVLSVSLFGQCEHKSYNRQWTQPYYSAWPRHCSARCPVTPVCHIISTGIARVNRRPSAIRSALASRQMANWRYRRCGPAMWVAMSVWSPRQVATRLAPPASVSSSCHSRRAMWRYSVCLSHSSAASMYPGHRASMATVQLPNLLYSDVRSPNWVSVVGIIIIILIILFSCSSWCDRHTTHREIQFVAGYRVM